MGNSSNKRSSSERLDVQFYSQDNIVCDITDKHSQKLGKQQSKNVTGRVRSIQLNPNHVNFNLNVHLSETKSESTQMQSYGHYPFLSSGKSRTFTTLLSENSRFSNEGPFSSKEVSKSPPAIEHLDASSFTGYSHQPRVGVGAPSSSTLSSNTANNILGIGRQNRHVVMTSITNVDRFGGVASDTSGANGANDPNDATEANEANEAKDKNYMSEPPEKDLADAGNNFTDRSDVICKRKTGTECFEDCECYNRPPDQAFAPDICMHACDYKLATKVVVSSDVDIKEGSALTRSNSTQTDKSYMAKKKQTEGEEEIKALDYDGAAEAEIPPDAISTRSGQSRTSRIRGSIYSHRNENTDYDGRRASMASAQRNNWDDVSMVSANGGVGCCEAVNQFAARTLLQNPNKEYNATPCCKKVTHWELDPASGEWYKTSERCKSNIPRYLRPPPCYLANGDCCMDYIDNDNEQCCHQCDCCYCNRCPVYYQ